MVADPLLYWVNRLKVCELKVCVQLKWNPSLTAQKVFNWVG